MACETDKYAVVAALHPVNPAAADTLAASVAGALLNVLQELATKMTSAMRSDSTASELSFMGKAVLGTLSSFAGQTQIVDADIKARAAGCNSTFPGTLSLDALLARINDLERHRDGAIDTKRGAPSGDISDPTLTLAWWP